jgi:hypothetical protein
MSATVIGILAAQRFSWTHEVFLTAILVEITHLRRGIHTLLRLQAIYSRGYHLIVRS